MSKLFYRYILTYNRFLQLCKSLKNNYIKNIFISLR
nr:MAG TPA: hypothetical protein [Caudoviricetes sp.]